MGFQLINYNLNCFVFRWEKRSSFWFIYSVTFFIKQATKISLLDCQKYLKNFKNFLEIEIYNQYYRTLFCGSSKIHYYSPKLLKKIVLFKVQIFILYWLYYLVSNWLKKRVKLRTNRSSLAINLFFILFISIIFFIFWINFIQISFNFSWRLIFTTNRSYKNTATIF
jgi:hypothetical protein